ncbi:LysE family translocator [Chromohalobacter nigrandesensis]|uniref:LysE family translocator n=1 Tax=Chromohalobacter nigrandesensis TaxID=119863 RepID=UPI001FF46820|nr:LysE family transporter [Chromohalobacter nigrandesensis]MCK0746029.1 LysE family transporter [Chromohalobacter nigrandesensis]
MLALLTYAISVMYTPGPVNLLGLNAGINGQTKTSSGFYIGVGTAMFLMLLLLGWLGSVLIQGKLLWALSALGTLYILYLSIKIASSTPYKRDMEARFRPLQFKEGLLMQLLNPKGIVATLPIATIQLPAMHIEGPHLIMMALLIGVLAAGAPGSYALLGGAMGKAIHDHALLRFINIILALLLAFTGLIIGYEYVVLPLIDS